MKNKKTSNYVKLGIIIAAAVLLTLVICNVYKNIVEKKSNTGYISQYVSSIKYDEIKSAVVEFSSNTFLYISYTGNKDIYDFEKSIKPTVKNDGADFNFVYVNVTDLMKKDNYLDDVNSSLGLKKNSILKLPAIVYYKDNTIVDYIDSSDHLLTKGDFSKLLDEYELSSDDSK